MASTPNIPKTQYMRSLDLFRILSCTSWGADHTILLRLYQALVGSRLSYDCKVFTSATITRLCTLNAVHHAAVRLSTGAFRSSPPISSLLVDARVPPLNLHRDGLLIKYWYRLRRQSNNPAHTVAFETPIYILYIETNLSYLTPLVSVYGM